MVIFCSLLKTEYLNNFVIGKHLNKEGQTIYKRNQYLKLKIFLLVEKINNDKIKNNKI
jgi:hypothetical protein